MITQEKLQEMKNTYLDTIKGYLNTSGGIDPHLTLFAEHRDKNEQNDYAVIHVPILNKFMKDDKEKQRFVDEIIPQMGEKLNEKFDLRAIIWASEAWVRSAPKEGPVPENYKELPIEKEIVILTFESDDLNEMQIYEMIRKGKQVNKNGTLTDHVELVFDKELSGTEYPKGRFSNLLKKFRK